MNLFDYFDIDFDTNDYNKILEMTKNITIHDYQIGVLYCYKNLPKLLKNHSFVFESTGFGTDKEWFFTTEVEYSEILKKIKKGYNCNALQKYKYAVKRVETCYELPEIFKKENYLDGKKFRKRVNYMINYFEKNNFQIKLLPQEDLEKAIQLHDRWVEHKLSQPDVMKNLFPRARYKNCLKYSFNKDNIDIRSFAVYDGSEMICVRTIFINGNKAYDLSFIVDAAKQENSISECCNINLLRYFKDNLNIKFFNCGLSEGKLKKYKQHYYYFDNIYYRYTKAILNKQ